MYRSYLKFVINRLYQQMLLKYRLYRLSLKLLKFVMNLMFLKLQQMCLKYRLYHLYLKYVIHH